MERLLLRGNASRRERAGPLGGTHEKTRPAVHHDVGRQDRSCSTWEFEREPREAISYLCRFLSVLSQRTCQPDLPPTALRWYKHCRRIAHRRLGHATVVAGGGGSDPRLRTRLGRPLLL